MHTRFDFRLEDSSIDGYSSHSSPFEIQLRTGMRTPFRPRLRNIAISLGLHPTTLAKPAVNIRQSHTAYSFHSLLAYSGTRRRRVALVRRVSSARKAQILALPFRELPRSRIHESPLCAQQFCISVRSCNVR